MRDGETTRPNKRWIFIRLSLSQPKSLSQCSTLLGGSAWYSHGHGRRRDNISLFIDLRLAALSIILFHLTRTHCWRNRRHIILSFMSPTTRHSHSLFTFFIHIMSNVSDTWCLQLYVRSVVRRDRARMDVRRVRKGIWICANDTAHESSSEYN